MFMNENKKIVVGIIFLAGFIIFLIALGKIFHFDIDQTRAFLLQYPLWLNGLIYIFLYVFSTTLIWLGPKDVVRVLGALFYGAGVSTVLVYIAELINALIMFSLSRKLGRDVVLKSWFKQKDIDKAKDNTTLLGIIALRVNMLVSFRVLDLVYGLTRVPFRKYFTAAVIVSPLRLFVVQYSVVLLWDVFKTIKTFDHSALIRLMAEMTRVMMENPSLMKWYLGYFLIVVILSVAAVIEKVILKRRRKAAAVSNDV